MKAEASTPTMLPASLAAFRAQIPGLERRIHLSNCSQGPLANPVREAIEAFVRMWDEIGMDWDAWVEEVERARAAFARLVGAAPEDVAIGTTLSQLASSVVSALVTEPGATRRRIVSDRAEFPGVGQAILAATKYGWEVTQAPWDIERHFTATDIVNLVDESTALVTFPHVVYANGSMVDPDEVIAAGHAAGALVLMDTFQSAGTMPLDVRQLGVDLLMAGPYKYLMGTAGVSFLYVSPSVRERFEPAVTGWFGRPAPKMMDPSSLDYPPGASRFDLGTPPLLAAYASRPALELVMAAGPALIRERVLHLSRLALDLAPELGLRVLGPATPESKGATNAFDAGSSERAIEVQRRLRSRGILTSPRERAIRLAPHGFTHDDELEHGMRELATVLQDLA